MSLGVPGAPAIAVSGTDNDWGTKCDRILNPNGVEVTNECAAAPAASAWQNEVGGGAGHRSGLAVGYRWGALRVEGEYSHRITIYDGRADLNIFDDVTLDKRAQEIELAIGGVDDLQAHTLFANTYYDVASVGSVTPYVGVGMGVERVSLAYFSHWKRNDDPARITTFVDPTLRATIARHDDDWRGAADGLRDRLSGARRGGVSAQRPHHVGSHVQVGGFWPVREYANRVEF